jgi:hypothetical protein
MKTIRKFLLIVTIILISTSIYCQTASSDLLKKENVQLKKDLAKTKQAKDSFQILYSKMVQDTTFLRKELALCKLYNDGQKFEVINSNRNFKATFISCKGSRASQSVELSFIIQHGIPNQEFRVSPPEECSAYDAQGQVYKARFRYIGGKEMGSYTSVAVPTNVPIKVSMVFNNILSGNDFFKVISLKYNSQNLDYSNKQTGELEFKNVKVIWD